MSAIADFRLIDITKLKELERVAKPYKGLFGKVRDSYFDFLNQNAISLREYEWSGYIYGTLLVFLEEKGINLMKSRYDSLSKFITESRNSTCFIFDEEHKGNYDEMLKPENFNEVELGQYYNEFNETNEENAGKAMLDGIEVLHESIGCITSGKVIVFGIY